VVLFGGYNSSGNLSDTWIWDGTDWTEETPATSPSARGDCAMKYDAARGQVVLFGGDGTTGALNDTWLWNGKNWTQAEPGTSPPASYAGAMAYDAADDRVVLFGGLFNSDGTWTWDGTNWIQQNPSISPPGRVLPGMAYDSEEGKVVLFGGFGANPNFNDTWEWNGSNWTQQTPPDFPSARNGMAMAPDAQGSVVLFGGYNPGVVLSDTWVWAKGPEASLNPTSLTFGKQKVDTSSAAQQIQLTNSGINTLTIGSMAFTGSDPKDFEKANNCHGSLKPGFSCMIDVVFKPTAKGARSAKLVIKDNAQNGSQSISLSGTGD
jgi:hypothetical protein